MTPVSNQQKKFACLLKSHLEIDLKDTRGFMEKYCGCEAKAKIGSTGSLGNNNVENVRLSIDKYYGHVFGRKNRDLSNNYTNRNEIFLSNSSIFQDEFPHFILTIKPSLHQDIYEAYVHKLYSAFNSKECQLIVEFYNNLRKIRESFEVFKLHYEVSIKLVPFKDIQALISKGNPIPSKK